MQPDARTLWRQSTYPVVFRDTAQKRLLVKLPWAEGNGHWLRDGRHHRPVWLKQWKCWQVPHAWLDDVTRRLCQRYASVYVVQPYRERETCAPACWNAMGIECECSCLGANHGQGDQGKAWYIVSDTCAVHWGTRQYACRFLQQKGSV